MINSSIIHNVALLMLIVALVLTIIVVEGLDDDTLLEILVDAMDH